MKIRISRGTRPLVSGREGLWERRGGCAQSPAPPAGLARPSRLSPQTSTFTRPTSMVPPGGPGAGAGKQNPGSGAGSGTGPGERSRVSRSRAWRQTFFLMAAARRRPRLAHAPNRDRRPPALPENTHRAEPQNQTRRRVPYTPLVNMPRTEIFLKNSVPGK